MQTPSIPLRRYLLDVTTAAAVLDIDSKKVFKLLENGSIEWAFDIRSKHAGRTCHRIFALSLLDYVEGKQGSYDFDAIFKLLLPGQAEHTVIRRVASALNCKPDFVGILLDDGSLKRVDKPRRQPKEAWQIWRRSVYDFLKSRRL